MTDHIVVPVRESGALSGPLVSVAPIALPAAGRPVELQVRVTAPMVDRTLPAVVLSHGRGPSQGRRFAEIVFGPCRPFASRP
jgi:predicted dienelactone hydrolase